MTDALKEVVLSHGSALREKQVPYFFFSLSLSAYPKSERSKSTEFCYPLLLSS